MKRWISFAAALCVLTVPAAQAGQLYVHADAQFVFHNDGIYFADAHYDYDIFDFRTANVYGVATLNGSGQPSQYFGPTMANHPDIASGQWDFAGTYAYCYQAYATAFEDLGGTTQGAGSATLCVLGAAKVHAVALVGGRRLHQWFGRGPVRRGHHGHVNSHAATELSVHGVVG